MTRKTIELYTDAAGEHRWRLRSGNSQTTCGPEEGYRRPGARTKAMARDLAGIFTADKPRDLEPARREGAPAVRRCRVGVLRRMEPNATTGLWAAVEIPVVEVQD